MPGSTTPDAIPYMLATDEVAQFDEHSLSLATRLQALFAAIQGGNDTITPSAASTNTTKTITFPTPYATGKTPRVVVCLGEAVNAGGCSIWVTGITNTQFTLGIHSVNTTTRAIKWIAVQ